MSEEMREFLTVLACAITGMGILVSALVFGAIASDKYSCAEISKGLRTEYVYDYRVGCRIKYDNLWVPVEALRIEK